MIFEKRRNKRNEIRELKTSTREARKKNRIEKKEARKQRMLMKKYSDGGIVYPVRLKYNRRILLLTRLRRIK